jgi:hypothetical protein
MFRDPFTSKRCAHVIVPTFPRSTLQTKNLSFSRFIFSSTNGAFSAEMNSLKYHHQTDHFQQKNSFQMRDLRDMPATDENIIRLPGHPVITVNTGERAGT